MGWSEGRERGFWKVWLADVNGKVEKVISQSTCQLVHEWCRCFDCLISELTFVCSIATSLPKQIIPLLSSHYSIAEDRLKYRVACLYS